MQCNDTQEFWRVENKDSGGRLRGAVRRVDAKRQKMDRQVMEQQEFGANNEPCLGVDPAAEVREAHGAGSLPNEPVVSVQRSLVCSILLLSRPILPQQLQPIFVGVFSPILLCRLNRGTRRQQNSDCQKSSICSCQKQALDGVFGSSRYLTAYINIELFSTKKGTDFISHQGPWPWFVASFADWR